MKKTATLSLLLLTALAAGPALTPARAAGTASTTAGQALIPPATDDDDFPETDPNAPDLRLVVAAPRAAITAPLGSVLTRARLGRTVNVIKGETVRFVSGIKEAVWYSGAGPVSSTLKIFGQDPNGRPLLTGSDKLILTGVAPKIDSGRTRVDVPFPTLGSFPIAAFVGVTALPRNGTGVNRTNSVPYVVKVWNASDLGDITGTVTDVSTASPLEGFRVVALDPNSRKLVAATYTSCDGTYDLKRLPPDDYVVVVRGQQGYHQEFFEDVTDPNAATPVAVSAGAITPGIDFQLGR